MCFAARFRRRRGCLVLRPGVATGGKAYVESLQGIEGAVEFTGSFQELINGGEGILVKVLLSVFFFPHRGRVA